MGRSSNTREVEVLSMVTIQLGVNMNFFVRLAPWTVLLFLASCGPTELDGPFAAVMVYGQVITSAGTSVSGAPVALAWRPSDTCEEEVFTIAYDTTDAQGRYAGSVGNWGSLFVACIRVIADSPLGESLLADTVFKTGVVIEAKPRQDSLAVNLALQPSGT